MIELVIADEHNIEIVSRQLFCRFVSNHLANSLFFVSEC